MLESMSTEALIGILTLLFGIVLEVIKWATKTVTYRIRAKREKPLTNAKVDHENADTISELITSVGRLNRLNDEQTKQYTLLQAEFLAQKEEIANVNMQYGDIVKQYEDLLSQNANLLAQNEDQLKRYKLLKSRFTVQARKIAKLESDYVHVLRQNKELDNLKEEMECALLELKAENETLKEMLDIA